jgi:proteic killer suppression protein
MEILFNTTKMQKACNSERESVRQWGTEIAKKLRQRLAELTAADNLEVVSKLPPVRCHQLYGNRAGQFAVALKHPFRLIFVPGNDPLPLKPDGGFDLAGITKICILEVIDYHGD